ncbi:hypothetical protein CAEBREN_28503 [Caenorhabditis brenneri]|uniref:DH domain-containing protein n=1 Tax=Caenorhabditis brenneri TaxID=135651 RepID=G0P9C7_CAEBE|nr:hypothetical protein CAEBREN_28503 [Caenorhabditis brenneri]
MALQELLVTEKKYVSDLREVLKLDDLEKEKLEELSDE